MIRVPLVDCSNRSSRDTTTSLKRCPKDVSQSYQTRTNREYANSECKKNADEHPASMRSLAYYQNVTTPLKFEARNSPSSDNQRNASRGTDTRPVFRSHSLANTPVPRAGPPPKPLQFVDLEPLEVVARENPSLQYSEARSTLQDACDRLYEDADRRVRTHELRNALIHQCTMAKYRAQSPKTTGERETTATPSRLHHEHTTISSRRSRTPLEMACRCEQQSSEVGLAVFQPTLHSRLTTEKCQEIHNRRSAKRAEKMHMIKSQETPPSRPRYVSPNSRNLLESSSNGKVYRQSFLERQTHYAGAAEAKRRVTDRETYPQYFAYFVPPLSPDEQKSAARSTTIENVARELGCSLELLLQNNVSIKPGQKLFPNQMLIVPVSPSASQSSKNSTPQQPSRCPSPFQSEVAMHGNQYYLKEETNMECNRGVLTEKRTHAPSLLPDPITAAAAAQMRVQKFARARGSSCSTSVDRHIESKSREREQSSEALDPRGRSQKDTHNADSAQLYPSYMRDKSRSRGKLSHHLLVPLEKGIVNKRAVVEYENMIHEREMNESKELTFKPHIDPYSTILVRQLMNRCRRSVGESSCTSAAQGRCMHSETENDSPIFFKDECPLGTRNLSISRELRSGCSRSCNLIAAECKLKRYQEAQTCTFHPQTTSTQLLRHEPSKGNFHGIRSASSGQTTALALNSNETNVLSPAVAGLDRHCKRMDEARCRAAAAQQRLEQPSQDFARIRTADGKLITCVLPFEGMEERQASRTRSASTNSTASPYTRSQSIITSAPRDVAPNNNTEYLHGSVHVNDGNAPSQEVYKQKHMQDSTTHVQDKNRMTRESELVQHMSQDSKSVHAPKLYSTWDSKQIQRLIERSPRLGILLNDV